MQQRNPWNVWLLSVVTIGVYIVVWHVQVRREMNALGANIPPSWMLIVPLLNLYWLGKFSIGVEHVTKTNLPGVSPEMPKVEAFLWLSCMLGIGCAVIQHNLNAVARQLKAD